MENLTKDALRSLTIEQLNKMNEDQLNEIANMVIENLEEEEISQLSKEVRKKLKITREGSLCNWQLWISLLISALAMSLIQLIMGE